MERKKNNDNFLKRKTQRKLFTHNKNKYQNKTSVADNSESINTNKNFDKISQIEILYKRAKNIYEEKVFNFNLISHQNLI